VYAGLKFTDNDISVAPPVSDFGVYKSTDGSETWGPSQDGLLSTLNVNVVVVHPMDAAIVYAGTIEQGIFRSSDGGETWQQVNQGISVLVENGRRPLDIRALAIDPEHPGVLYAGLDGGGVYKSTDGGESWQRSSSGMDPQAAIRDIVVDPTNPQILYVADLRTGVYRSDDGGKLWVRINERLTTRAVKALAISTDGSTLYAAIQGEGVFRLDLTTPGGG
jgi:photosystem II stability/assembly factor-like uncharacterized protein